MTVRLRPHHVLCILTHVGEGYSSTFTANMAMVIDRISAGENITIVTGPDDICAPLLKNPFAHCRRRNVDARDRAALEDLEQIFPELIRPDHPIVLNTTIVRSLRDAFATTKVRSASRGYEWEDLCDSVAADGFVRTLLSKNTSAVS